MIEILKVIVLTCQIGNGFRILTPVIKYQKKCQKKLIECVSKTKQDTQYTLLKWTGERLSECIKERE